MKNFIKLAKVLSIKLFIHKISSINPNVMIVDVAKSSINGT
jgi:hypothetical protein